MSLGEGFALLHEPVRALAEPVPPLRYRTISTSSPSLQQRPSPIDLDCNLGRVNHEDWQSECPRPCQACRIGVGDDGDVFLGAS